MNNEKIDFVVTWVNGNDPEWLASKNDFLTEEEKKLNQDARYREWDIFQYWFRSIEKYSPWVNKIFLITEGHLPEWLEVENEKLVIINHSDYIPSEFLPTFNSNVIELMIPKIEELSNNFVLFNDDVFLNSEVIPKDFFYNGIPKDIGILNPIIPKQNSIDNIILNNMHIINSKFSKKEVLKKYRSKFYSRKYKKLLIKNFLLAPWQEFTGFYDPHVAVSYNKSLLLDIHKESASSIEKTLRNKFRTNADISHWLYRYWQLCLGNFEPRSVDFGIHLNLNDINFTIKCLNNKKYKMLCLNDSEKIEEYERKRDVLHEHLDKKFPKKSTFEK